METGNGINIDSQANIRQVSGKGGHPVSGKIHSRIGGKNHFLAIFCPVTVNHPVAATQMMIGEKGCIRETGGRRFYSPLPESQQSFKPA